MKINDLKIGVRLGLGFGLLLLLMMALAGIGLQRTAAINASLDRIVNDNNVKIKTAMEMRQSVMTIALATRNMALATDADQRDSEVDRIADDRDEYKANLEALEHRASSPADQAVLAKIAAARAATDPLTDRVVALLKQQKGAEAVALLDGQMRPNQRKWVDTLDELVRLQEKQADLASEAAQASYRGARLLTLSITALALLLGVAAAVAVTRSITGPLREAVALALRVADGDLTGETVVHSRDETGQLMQALKDMHDSLVKIVAQVRSGTETIGVGAREIAEGNLDLSARTEQQAAALEETASSMEQLMATVQQNAANARQADSMARSASQVAVKGGAMVGQVVQTMGAINTSAKRIVDIIAVIDGIAFQTNILALNAAVEAARAGEQGRGFAVVAGEVRNLAHRSASAAKEIKQLIEDSVQQVSAGSVLVDQTGATMQEIVASVKRVTDIMDDITAASDEQTSGISQINQAVSQMDSVTQQNAALVEQAAAAAQGLQEQSVSLAALVDLFRLDGAEPDPDPAPVLQLATTTLRTAPARHAAPVLRQA
ncbi:MAG: methyl-accepting chemotaxis protein [Pseudomonadota bacterium]